MCRSIGCTNPVHNNSDFCVECDEPKQTARSTEVESSESMALKYPKYYKPVGDLTEIDVYAVHHLFDIKDPSGAIQHASKKLLLSGVRTGGKSPFKDISEARDTLTRWLQLNEDTQ
jgi:hypothetical protein